MTVLRMTLDGVTHDLDLERCRISEADECERLTGWTWVQWRDQLAEQRGKAVAFAWWIAAKRNGAPLSGRFSELDFDMADMGVEIAEPDEPDDEPAVEAAVAGPTSPEPLPAPAIENSSPPTDPSLLTSLG